jgi:hypothetical protein
MDPLINEFLIQQWIHFGINALGFSKGTLHYTKQNAKSDKPFTLNSHVLERANKWEALVSTQK